MNKSQRIILYIVFQIWMSLVFLLVIIADIVTLCFFQLISKFSEWSLTKEMEDKLRERTNEVKE